MYSTWINCTVYTGTSTDEIPNIPKIVSLFILFYTAVVILCTLYT